MPTKLRLVWAGISQATASHLLVNFNCGKFQWVLLCHLVTKQILISPSKTVLPSIPSQTTSIFNFAFSSLHHRRRKLVRHQMLNMETMWPDQPATWCWMAVLPKLLCCVLVDGDGLICDSSLFKECPARSFLLKQPS